MHRRARRVSAFGVVAMTAVLVSSSVAWAAVSVTTPAQNPFAVPGDPSGNPLPFDIAVSGLNQFQPAFAVECDGVSPQTPGYTVSEHCDNGSSGSSVNGDASGNATFAANSANNHLRVFKGESPQSFFNCLSPNDPDPNNGLPSYRNCQVRVSAGTPADTSNQQFFTIVLPDDPGDASTTTSTSTTTTTESTTTSTSTTTTTLPNVIPDTTPPTPHITGLAKVTLSTKVSPTWSGVDTGGSGMANFDVQLRVAPWNGNFSAWSTWKATTALTTAQYSTTAGHSVCFRVRARDHAANLSAYTTQTCTSIPLTSASLGYSTGWTKTTTSAAYGGFQYSTKTKGKTATRTGAKARTIFLVVQKCSSCGIVQVKFNGAVFATVNLAHNGTLHKQVVQVANFSSVRSGTILITVTSPNGKVVVLEGVAVFAS